MPAVLELEGKLDPERLDRAFKELIERHESLRTSFEQDESGEPVRCIHDEVPFTLQTAVLGEQTEQEAAPRLFSRLISAKRRCSVPKS